MARDVRVNIIGDSRPLERAFSRSSRATKEFAGTLGAVDRGLAKVGAGRAAFIGGFAGAGAAIIAPKVINTLMDAVDAASDLNEQITKNQQVFGASSAAVLKWSETTSKSIGVSRRAALEASGTFGNLFTAIGIGGADAERFSERLVTLAADLASFNNANIDDVLTAIRSGLVGEIEPLRRYGVLLSAARVEQVALAETGKDNVRALTDQEKAHARLSIIFRDSTKAQGDFARTSGGLANQQRILKAQVSDLQANLGRLLLPAMVKVTGALVDATGGALKLIDGLERLGRVKIPPIHIPFMFDFPGGSIVGTIGNLTKGFFENLPMNRAILELVDRIKEQFDTEAAGATPGLANAFRTSIETMTQNALDSAVGSAKQPTVKKPPKGFGTGLTPADLFGPLVKDIPAALQEALLDAQNRGAGPREIRAILERQRDSLLNALDDPRLKRKGRIEIKQKVKAVNDAIAAVNAQIAQIGTDAAAKRQAAVDKATQAAKDAAAKQRAGFDELMANLGLQVDAAAATRGFADDLRRNTQLQNAIKAQIKVEGRTAELAGQLAQARRDRSTILANQLQARQFRAIGLSASGDEILPTIANLRKQFEQLSKNVVGQDVPQKLLNRLKLVGKALSGGIKNATPETLKAIRDLFNDIRSTFNQEANKGLGNQVRIQLSDKILTALGFGQDPDVIRKLARARSVGAPPLPATVGAPAAQGMTINGPITVVADDPDAFLRQLQKKAGRTTATARGRFPGRSLGLG